MNMNPNELMIGDWVRFSPHHEENPHFFAIFEMSQNNVKVHESIEGERQKHTLSYDNVEPIPLTHEILVKNGLRECFDGAIEYENFNEDKNFLLEITEVDGDVWWTINVAEYRIAKLEYVHQLQHAIRLLGIDKEIIL